jgi:hypothetical protein
MLQNDKVGHESVTLVALHEVREIASAWEFQ